MAAKTCFPVLVVLIVTVNISVEAKVVPNVGAISEFPKTLEDDETVNINIKNGAGLKISYPAGEIIVPSERKNVRIKTIDVFEERNSPPVAPNPPEPYPYAQDGSGHNFPNYPYYEHFNQNKQDKSAGNGPYPWQQHVPAKQGGTKQIQEHDFRANNYDDYNSYEYDKKPATAVQQPPGFHLAVILDLLQEIVWAGAAFLHGGPAEIMNMLFYLIQKYLFDNTNA